MSADPQRKIERKSFLEGMNSLQISSRPVNNGTGTQINNNNSDNGRQYINNSNGKQWNAEIQNFVDIKQKEDFSFRRPVGICLRKAPIMARELFIGRVPELDQMTAHLHGTQCQRCLVLGGMGGIGKTRLALTYAESRSDFYGSVFWLDATSEAILIDSFRSIAGIIFEVQDSKLLEGKEVIRRIHYWLSDTKNPSWLIIFDNYDDDSDQFNISDYYPPASQGVIIITTRRPDIITGRTKTLDIKAFQSIEDGLAILETRSKRLNVQSDPYAKLLAERLGGLPLALATAGTYLQRSSLTFERYLQEYEKRWNIDPRRPTQLQDYRERTLYMTWDISYDRLKIEDLDAAKLLKLLAYFGNQGLWYKLFSEGLTDTSLEWIHDILIDDLSFQGVMAVLTDWYFLEVDSSSVSWSMHNCVHDWTLAALNKDINTNYYWFAIDCVEATTRGFDRDSFGNIVLSRSTGHATRLANRRFLDVVYDPTPDQLNKLSRVSILLRSQIQLIAAEQMNIRALAGYEKTLGPDHLATLDSINNLGLLYHDQGKLDEAEKMHMRALAGYEKALGPDHLTTLDSINNLGNLYRDQGKLDEAEQMHMRALAGKEKTLGPDHTSTLDSINNLGNLYHDQGKLDEAEQMHMRALAGKDKTLGPDHTSTLDTVNNLGNLYRDQGKLDEAEQMYMRALAGREKALGPDHLATLDSINNLGNLYHDQGKLDEAEQMYMRALAGKEKTLGPDHTSTLDTVNNLGLLYHDQGKLDKAEQMYMRALAGREKALGPNHSSTLATARDLALLYCDQGKLRKAAKFLWQAGAVT
ncbi:hypothetical protein N7495_004313 [Penicillium taxi]|uniref:uncharacterized protein n=1 Tax=Penicillium taxi TaxID=168475 RepID=UPI0025458EDC|nr:uncharacterized protein N7495_004313 [Penicillium taxi]KAJ5899569.1 hypothetical protein N7495_004313 [Penicillium taxi]